MALYTIILSVRRHHYAFQVEERSVMDALRKWTSELDHSNIRDFGAISKRRLIDDLEKHGPCEFEGLVNVATWHASLGGKVITVWIIETDPQRWPPGTKRTNSN